MQQIDFSLVIPFYNEEENVESVLQKIIHELNNQSHSYEIIAVDNGSKDNTSNILSKIASTNSRIKIITIEINQGYGYGISTGLQHTKGTIIGYTDGDNQVNPKDILRCVELMYQNKLISLYKGIRKNRQDGLLRIFYSKGYNYLARLLFNLKVKDINAKPKLFYRSIYDQIKPIVSKEWFIDAEILIKANNIKINITEIPGEFEKRNGGKSNVKFNTALILFKELLKVRFRGIK